MRKSLLLTFGVIELLFPRRLIGAAERIAFENQSDCELRAWTVPVARLEGITYLAIVLWDGGFTPWFRRLFGFFGAFAFLFPRRCMGFGTRVAYRNPDGCEWKPWTEPAIRLVGLLVVILLSVRTALGTTTEVPEAAKAAT